MLRATTLQHRLNESSHKLRDAFHLKLVLMVWRDFLIPAANNDDLEAINSAYRKPRLSAIRISPDRIEDDDFSKPESDDEEVGNDESQRTSCSRHRA
jgi:hypothetical protein